MTVKSIFKFQNIWPVRPFIFVFPDFESSEFSQIVFCRITQTTLLLPLAPATNYPPKGFLNLWYVWCLLVSVNRNILVLVLRFVVNWKAFGFTSSGILLNKKLREHWYQLFDVAVVTLCSQMLIYAVFKTNHFGSGSFFITQRTRTVIFTKVMASWRKTLSLFLSTSSLITLQQAIVLFHLKWKRTTLQK